MDAKTEGRTQRFVSLLCKFPKFSTSEDDDEDDKTNRCKSYRIYVDGSGVEMLTLRRKGGYNLYNPDTPYEVKAIIVGGTQAHAHTYKYYPFVRRRS
jgi:hypothetical protein